MISRRLLPLFALVLSALILPPRSVQGGSLDDESLVGILATAVSPKMAEQLRLTEEQLSALQSVIKERESLGLSLAAQLRELPPEERELKQREFVRQSEKEGFAKLNFQQRTVLQQMKISKLGLASLADQEVAETVGLSQGQVNQVNEVLANRAAIVREVGRERAAAEMELRLKAVLTLQQLTTWQAMAGKTKVAEAGGTESPKPSESTETKITAPAVETVANDSATSQTQEDANAKTESGAASQTAVTDEQAMAEMAKMIPSNPSNALTINFKEAQWEQVLRWVAREAELSLQANVYPPGTFTYSDPYRTYTLAETLNIMNRVLLQEGYSLLRYGRVLSVLDLGSEDTTKAELVRGYIREVSELVTPEELATRGEYELCKCLFILSRLSPDEAKKEIEQLIGPHGSVIALPAAGQVLVTETVSKLRLIQKMLNRSEDPESSLGSKVLVINLKHVAAEEVLGAFRPLVNMNAETNTSQDISFSTDTFGNTIYATGKADKLQILGDLAKRIDVEPSEANGSSVAVDQPMLQTHAVMSSDPDTALEVLQTLLAGAPNVRLSKDPQTNKIIAYATKSDQELIAKTLTTLAGMASEFTIIQLKRIDTQAAILTLEKFFGKKSSTTADKDAPSTSNGPIFYGDTIARTIMVQGTESQIMQVKSLLSKLEDSGPQNSLLGENMKVLPYTGKSADKVLDQVKTLWESGKRKNRIRELKPAERSSAVDRRRPERARRADANETPTNDPKSSEANETKPVIDAAPEIQPSPAQEAPANPEPTDTTSLRRSPNGASGIGVLFPAGRFVSNLATVAITSMIQPPESESSEETEEPENEDEIAEAKPEDEQESYGDIVIYRGPTGLVITSEDKEALAEFEQMMQMFGSQLANGPAEPTVIYLKYVKAAAAEELLKGILSGESSGGGGGGLLGNVASGMLGELGGGLIGGLLGGGGRSSGSSSTSGTGISGGDVTINSDPRLNALIVQASPLDIDYIEQLLEVIDQEDSPLNVETRGTPRIIEVVNQDVEVVANVVKQAFADRISQGESGAQRQPTPQEFIAALRGGGQGGRGGGQSQLKESTMTIATDPKSNSLIVTASSQLFDQVEALVKMLDQASAANEEQVQVVQLGGNINPIVVQNALQSVLGPQVRTNAVANQTNPNNNNRQQGQQGRQGFQGGFPGGFQGGGGFPGGFQGFPGGGGNAFQFGPGGQGGNRGGNQGGGNNARGFQFPGNFGGGNFGGGNFGGGNFGGQNFGGQGGNRGNQGNTNRGGNNRGGNNQRRN